MEKMTALDQILRSNEAVGEGASKEKTNKQKRTAEGRKVGENSV